MKSTLLWLIASLLVLQSCDFPKKIVVGNGNVITQTINSESFTQLSLDCKCDVAIVQSDIEQVIIEADENLHEYVMVTNRDGSLRINTPDHVQFQKTSKFLVTVSLKNIESFNNDGVGNVWCTNQLKLDRLNLNNSSVGNNDFNFDVKEINIDNTTVGNTTIVGLADKAHVKNSSVGNIDMEGFIVKILHIKNTAVGNIQVFASDEIYIKHSGIGDFTYAGNATVKEMDIAAMGSVTKKE